LPERVGDPVESLNPERLVELARGDRTAVPDLVREFFAVLPGLMAAIRSGLETRDPDATASAAHGLKGCAAALGLDRLAALCQEMEHLARGGALDGGTDQLTVIQEHLAVLAAHARRTWGLDVTS